MKRVGVAVAVLLVLAFACFVWPTMYKPVAIHEPASGGCQAARQNRVTGKVQWLCAHGQAYE